ncbi:Cd(II)/Pb(II)-responsive transcriptional regulator [Paraglaciecola chathamensis]|uniref:Cd(II)/Pb(II)-responsive transcriptional regulator n=1 Tax=Paraglaciecola chathamensis TaxID=368405 RepID=UPI0026FE6445|nr:Cd(II)/Pb(II)-responsive transcriptional regulator [Paraglaciecola chathamensis]MDO6561406.1 Cd(II)/Pb(II)-responsive transcriptional regulator [Paraglaciecola chathamensis]
MQIKQLAKVTNVNAKTIRYYEDVGLLPKAKRGDNGYRYYKQQDVSSLNFIRRCKELRMPLADIKRLVSIQSDDNAPCAEVDALITQQLEKIRVAQYELQQLEKNLQGLANSCDNHQIKNCEILNHLRTN